MSSLLRNSSLYLLSTIVLKATSFVLLPIYSSLIPPESYGKVYIVSSFVALFSILMTVSIQGAISRYFFDCKNRVEVNVLYSTIVYFVLFISIVITLTLTAFINTIRDWLNVPGIYIILAIGTVFFSTFYNLIISLLYVKQEAVKISIVTIILGVIQIVLQLILVIQMEDKALAIIFTMFVSGFLQFLMFIWFSKSYIVFQFSAVKLRKSLVYAISQFPSDISRYIVSLADRFILNKYTSSSVVGLYGMGNTLGSIPSIIFQSMNQALSPIVFTNYNDFENKKVESINYSCKLIEKIFVFITVLLTCILIYSNNIVLILSDKYVKSGVIMYLVLFAILIDIYRQLFSFPIAYKISFVKIKSSIWVIASVLSVALNLLLIPKYSYYGACFSLIITNVFTFLLIFYFSNKAMHPIYNRKILLIFALSVLTSFVFFGGTSIYAFIIKTLIFFIYLFAVLKIYPFDFNRMSNVIKNKLKK